MSARLKERFWAKVDKGNDPDGCWEWRGACDGKGYGAIKVGGRTLGAHRLAWQLFFGAIPSGTGTHGTCVLHRCDNRRCCNPTHLFLGTNDDNMADMRAKGRAMRGERHVDAKLTASQVREIRRATGRVTQRDLATRYGVHPSAISLVLARKTWRET